MFKWHVQKAFRQSTVIEQNTVCSHTARFYLTNCSLQEREREREREREIEIERERGEEGKRERGKEGKRERERGRSAAADGTADADTILCYN